MTLATRHGPIFPHRKRELPGGYMSMLASSHGMRVARRDDHMAAARKASKPEERAIHARAARRWNQLVLETIMLMRNWEALQS